MKFVQAVLLTFNCLTPEREDWPKEKLLVSHDPHQKTNFLRIQSHAD